MTDLPPFTDLPAFTALPDGAERLSALADQVHADLFAMRHPDKVWVPPIHGPDGEHVYNVVVAGAGQAGIAVGGMLQREGVDNFLLIDQRPKGKDPALHGSQ